MKVVIELIGNESKESLLATSNYLRELAGEAVPEATKAEGEEAPKTVAEIVESECAKTRARRTAKSAPAEEPAPIKEPAPIEEPAPAEEPAKVEEPAPKCDAASYTIDDCKSWAMKALNAKKRSIVQEAFESVGASSFPTLKPEMFYDFVAYISSRL